MHPRIDEEFSERASIECRWFTLHRAAERFREECETLAEVLQATQNAWHDARSRLAELEAMRDALGQELAQSDACIGGPAVNSGRPMI
jgi:DNA repair exonuclease SbcCD ATPase subunit